MNRTQARKIAETITNEQLVGMFKRAKNGITNWEKPSTVNNGCSKGVAWNILVKDFNVFHKYHILAKTNMVREFSEYLPEELQPIKVKKKVINTVHQNPNFDATLWNTDSCNGDLPF